MRQNSRDERRSQLKRKLARGLRDEATVAERRLWNLLRGKGMAGLRFRRQQPIGPFIVDFYCSAAKLIVELDGGQHGEDDKVAYDTKRDAWLASQGYFVLRFSNFDFLKHPDVVLDGIWLAIKERGTPLPEALRASTLPQGEGS